MADLITMLSAVAGQQGGEADEDFNQTVLLLHGDGTNGAQNNTFLDSSTNNFTITRNGNTTQGTFSPFSLAAGEWSNYFDGSSRLDFPTSATYQLGSSNFTYETWVYLTSDLINEPLIYWNANTSGYGALTVRTGSTSGWYIALSETGSAWKIEQNNIGTAQLNKWHHVAVVRNGDNVRIYIDGSDISSGGYALTSAGTSLMTTYTINQLAAYNNTSYRVTGYLSNTRIVIGAALYTSNFTPSTSPLTTTSQGATAAQTEILTCQSNRFADSSDNNAAVTINGAPRVTPFSPFAPTAAYSAGTNGGSGYFDGTGDNLTAPSNSALEPGSGNFTIEGWIFPLAYPASSTGAAIALRSNSSGYANFTVNLRSNGAIEAYFSLSNIGSVPSFISAGNAPIGAWTHVAFVKNGLTHTLYVNGTSVGTVTAGSNPPTGLTTVTTIGQADATLNGYLSDVRIVKDIVYSGNFTPPTAPLTAITNTSLLLNFTNAGIIDNTGKNNLETVGNAQIDTTTKKFGTGSMEFDGTGDYLQVRKTPEFEFGSGDFTIEFWANANAISGAYTGVVGVWVVGSAAGVNAWNVTLNAFDTTNKFGFDYVVSGVNNTNVFNATTSTGSWDHYAIVRSGSTLYGFKNGVSQTFSSGSSTITGAIAPGTADLYIGTIGTAFSGTTFNGFIDDLRITKGVARYTANFTAPTKAFPDQ